MIKKKTPNSEREINQKIQRLKVKLDQLQQMKQILLADGIKPDLEDKNKESKFIKQILGLQKDLKRIGSPGEKADVPKKVPFQKAKSRNRRPD